MKRFERASFAAGCLLLGWLVWRLGPERIGRSLADVGWGFLPILAVSSVPLLLNALSWSRVLPPGRHVPFSAMARMLLAGESINAVSPVGLVGGELVRVSLLSGRVPAEEAVACVGMAAMAQFAAQIVFVVTGLPFALSIVTNLALRRGLVTVAAVLAALLATVLGLAGSPPARAAIRSRLEGVPALGRLLRAEGRFRTAAREALATLRARPGRFAAAVACALAAWQAGAAETWLVLRFLAHPVGWRAAYAIEVLSVVIEGALFFVPAKIGTQEGGRALIFLAAGLDPATGFTLGLVRRLRELCWAALGLGILGRLGGRHPVKRPVLGVLNSRG